MSKNKFETLPERSEAVWALVSMVKDIGIAGPGCNKGPIEYNIDDFDDKHNKDTPRNYTSATLTWSGTTKNNIPCRFYHDYKIGMVLNPRQLETAHADFYAKASYGTTSTTTEKNPKHTKYGTTTSSGGKKIVGKSGYYRPRYLPKAATKKNPSLLEKIKLFLSKYSGKGFITNYAGWEAKEKKWYEETNASRFARNVWRRYFKHPKPGKTHILPSNRKKKKRYGGEGYMDYNEALVCRKEATKNPVTGIILDLTKDNEFHFRQIRKIIEILEKHQGLKLFTYDRDATNHIMRFIENDTAQNLLKETLDKSKPSSWCTGIKYKLDKHKFFNKASPMTEMIYYANGEISSELNTFWDEKTNVLLKGFDKQNIEQQKQDLLYSLCGYGKRSNILEKTYETRTEFLDKALTYGEEKLLAQAFDQKLRAEILNQIKDRDFVTRYEEAKDKISLLRDELGLNNTLSAPPYGQIYSTKATPYRAQTPKISPQAQSAKRQALAQIRAKREAEQNDVPYDQEMPSQANTSPYEPVMLIATIGTILSLIFLDSLLFLLPLGFAIISGAGAVYERSKEQETTTNIAHPVTEPQISTHQNHAAQLDNKLSPTHHI